MFQRAGLSDRQFQVNQHGEREKECFSLGSWSYEWGRLLRHQIHIALKAICQIEASKVASMQAILQNRCFPLLASSCSNYITRYRLGSLCTLDEACVKCGDLVVAEELTVRTAQESTTLSFLSLLSQLQSITRKGVQIDMLTAGSAKTGFCSTLAISSCGFSALNSANTLLCDTLALSELVLFGDFLCSIFLFFP